MRQIKAEGGRQQLRDAAAALLSDPPLPRCPGDPLPVGLLPGQGVEEALPRQGRAPARGPPGLVQDWRTDLAGSHLAAGPALQAGRDGVADERARKHGGDGAARLGRGRPGADGRNSGFRGDGGTRNGREEESSRDEVNVLRFLLRCVVNLRIYLIVMKAIICRNTSCYSCISNESIRFKDSVVSHEMLLRL